MKRLLLSIIVLLFASLNTGFTQNLSNQLYFSNGSLNAATTDSKTNTYCLVEVNKNSTLKINNISTSLVANNDGRNLYLIKFDKNYNIEWYRYINYKTNGESTILRAPSITVSNSAIYVNISEIGNSYDSASVTLATSPSTTNEFKAYVVGNKDNTTGSIIKMDLSGYAKWVHTEFDRVANWNTVIEEPTKKDVIYISKDPGVEHFLTKLDSNGNKAKEIQSPVSKEGSARFVDFINNIQSFNNSSSIITLSSNNTGGPKGFVNKFSSDLEWKDSFRIIDNFEFIDGQQARLTLDNDDNIYIVIHQSGSSKHTYRGAEYKEAGQILMKLDSNLDIQWSLPISYTDNSNNTLYSSSPQSIIFKNGKIFLTLRCNEPNSNVTIGEYTTAGDYSYLAEITTSGEVLAIDAILANYDRFNLINSSQGDYTFYGTVTDSIIIDSVVHYFSSANVLGKVSLRPNFIKGAIYYDLNKNNSHDIGEMDARNILLSIDNNKYYTGKTGKYIARGDSGKVYINPFAPKYYNLAPANDSVIFTTKDSTVTKNFALQPVDNINDLEVYLTNVTPARPGFNVIYRVTAKNIGTTVLNPTVKLTYDSLFTFQNSGPSPTTNSYPELTWSISNFKPGEVKDYTIRFTLASPPNANFGDTLCSAVEITPTTNDTTEDNNKDTLYQRVTGAYDPNIKEVNKPEIINVNDVNGSFAIDYTILFQNTGNDTAFHVYLIDRLDEDLKIQSIEVLSASHDYKMSISENNTLRWDYYNILLVDSNTNEAESHGFIKYRVWTKDNPALGDEFTNFADIYFDFNAPVRTNTTTNRIDKKESVQLIKGSTVIVYPNPTTDVFTVKADIKAGTKTTLQIIDLTGKVIYTENTQATTNGLETQIDINTLPQGIYFIKVYAGGEVYTAKVVKQ